MGFERPTRLARWRARAAELKADAHALYLACRDPRVPWYAKVLAGAVVAYALSPIDLIPDFIPILGQLDDLILVPLGVSLAIRLIPRPIYQEHRRAVDIRRRGGEGSPPFDAEEASTLSSLHTRNFM
jgi:uncharacterized membrane protein YkvA (DUF1232 family)